MSAFADDSAARARAQYIQGALPRQGLFAGHAWLTALEPFRLPRNLVHELETLGRVLLQFYRASDLLYRHSVEGKQPDWIAAWLDRGKPAAQIEWQRAAAFRKELPKIIRPDLLLTDEGLAITELDSVPGGIGLTAWLNETYSRVESVSPTGGNASILGGAEGMIEGFSGIFGEAPRVHIVVSDESATYRPEMAWLAARLGPKRFSVEDGDFDSAARGSAVYRFFELHDLDQVSGSHALIASAQAGHILLTPPPKAYLEEKLLFALLWNRNLRGFWHRELGEGFLKRMLALVPQTWVLDPSPLPPHAAYPGLDLTDWQQLKSLSQSQRQLVLKVSGYASDAWGARSVAMGHDLPSEQWSKAVDEALRRFHQNPFVLQRFKAAKQVAIPIWDDAVQQQATFRGRARLCPYYFVHGTESRARASLGGVLATLCPPDKKIIHGMSHAVLAPCAYDPV